MSKKKNFNHEHPREKKSKQKISARAPLTIINGPSLIKKKLWYLQDLVYLWPENVVFDILTVSPLLNVLSPRKKSIILMIEAP